MSIMDMFKSSPAPDNNSSQPPTEKSLSASPPSTDPSGKIPGSDGIQVNPLDAYKKMFDNADKSSDIQAPSFKLDPKVLGEVSKSMDFTKGIDPSLLEKALGGDAKSLMQVIQSVGQNSYSASLEHATALTETHLGQRAAFEGSRVDKGVKQQLTSNALSTATNYGHPVVKAELNRVASQYAAANPDASPQQIATAAQKYIADLNSALNPSKTPEQVTKEGETDWTKYLS